MKTPLEKVSDRINGRDRIIVNALMPSLTHTISPARNKFSNRIIKDSLTGFTLLEVLIVIAIIGTLMMIVVPFFGGSIKKAQVISSLNEMKQIKEAIQDFYADIGLVPEDLTHPEYATRYLCLKSDSAKERSEMENFFQAHLISSDLLDWDKYAKAGWRGPYMESDATYYEVEDDYYYPIITDAWNNEYLIEMDESQDRKSACIISLGANGEDDEDYDSDGNSIGDDIVMYIFGTAPTHFPENFDIEDWGY